MVPTRKYLRNKGPAKLRRPRVVRIIQQPTRPMRRPRNPISGHPVRQIIPHAKALIPRRIRMPQHPRQQPYHRIQNHRRSQLPTRKHIVANREFLIRQQPRSPAHLPSYRPQDQHHLLQSRQPMRRRLRKPLALRRQQNHQLPRNIPLRLLFNPKRLHTLEDRPCFQHHTLATAKRTIINRPMPITRKRPQIMRSNLNRTRCNRTALGDAMVELDQHKKLGKIVTNIEAHRCIGHNPCLKALVLWSVG